LRGSAHDLLPEFDATRIEHRVLDDFAAFDRPGHARIAANVSLRPYGATRTLASYGSPADAGLPR
jgi:hypothetical protein